jgi:hypothetical protein
MQAVVPLPYRPLAARQRPSKAVYRRRRLAVLLCVAALVALGWLGLHRLTGTSGDGPLTVSGRPVSTLDAHLVSSARTIVQPGDTLWSIARRAQPTGDVRPLVAELDAQRDGRPLQVGERIEVPRSK